MTKKESKNKESKNEVIQMKDKKEQLEKEKLEETVKVSDIKKNYTYGKQFDRYGIKTKNYLSIAHKGVIIDSIVEECLAYDDSGMLKCDFLNKEISINIQLLLNYSNIELDCQEDEFVEYYDFLDSCGFFDYVIESVDDSEIETISDLLECEIMQRLEIENGLGGVINRNLQNLIEKLPNDKQMKSIIKLAKKEINGLDMSKLGTLQELFLNMNSPTPDSVSVKDIKDTNKEIKDDKKLN